MNTCDIETEDLQPHRKLPAPRRLLSSLIHAIAAIPLDAASSTDADSATNTLRRVPLQHRSLLATLHVLFPALLLPALDLLDRRRVVRFPLSVTRQSSKKMTSEPALYQIRGDQAHVVHLRSWHCTCAFFALAVSVGTADRGDMEDEYDHLASSPLAFTTPPCKHLLACLLAEEWPALQEYTRMDGLGGVMDAASPQLLAGLVAGL